jgi:serine/threonine-protein kinase
MDCYPRHDLELFLHGDMSAVATAALVAHVEDCAACEEVLAELASAATLMAPAAPAHEDGEPVLSFLEHLRQAPSSVSDTMKDDPALALHPPAASSGNLSTQDSDVCALLRQRLAAVYPLGFAVWTSIMVLGHAGVDPLHPVGWYGWPALVALWGNQLVWTVGSLLIWLRRPWSLGGLRALEAAALVAHAGCLIVTSATQYRFFLTTGSAGSDVDIALLYASTLHNGFGWFAALVAWGLVFPHPWRRMLMLVCGLAACPLLVTGGLVLAEPAWLPALRFPLVLTGQMVVTGLAMAVFGSYRIKALEEAVAKARRAAREARQLGAYTLKRRLGKGGMGEVYLAEHRLLKRPCAVKLIRAERAGDPQVQARFDREVQATATLKHPNTVEIFDYGRTEDGTFYYVMEYLEGVSLEDAVRRYGPLPAARVACLLVQLCGALREAHRLGVIHRDIKPSNILLCRHGGLFDVVKLVDFGLALHKAGASSKLTHAGSLMGTPDYIAPEQADGSGVDARSDLYSVGATAYFLLTGRPLYTGETVLDILFAHRHQPVPELRATGPGAAEMAAILRRCLAKAPRQRFQDAVELERELRQCAEVAPWTEGEAQAWWEACIPSGDDPPSTSSVAAHSWRTG